MEIETRSKCSAARTTLLQLYKRGKNSRDKQRFRKKFIILKVHLKAYYYKHLTWMYDIYKTHDQVQRFTISLLAFLLSIIRFTITSTQFMFILSHIDKISLNEKWKRYSQVASATKYIYGYCTLTCHTTWFIQSEMTLDAHSHTHHPRRIYFFSIIINK